MKPIQIYIDGEPIEQETVKETKMDKYRTSLILELRILAHDFRYKTNYRKIRRDLIRQKKNEVFEKSIGLKYMGVKVNGVRKGCERCGKALTGTRRRWCSDDCGKLGAK